MKIISTLAHFKARQCVRIMFWEKHTFLLSWKMQKLTERITFILVELKKSHE
jgi:hypothetical protein